MLGFEQPNGRLTEQFTEGNFPSFGKFTECLRNRRFKSERDHLTQTARRHDAARAFNHLARVLLRQFPTLLFASARLVAHLRPFHLFEVACSHSRISAGLAFQPVTGRSQSPRLY
jgi:hypothetical protein